MYWRGHVGIALLAYAPIAGAVRAAGEPGLAVLGGVLAVAFSTLPDADHRLPLPHRGATHTVAFAVVVGTFTALAVGLVVTISGVVGIAGAAGTASIVAALPAWTPAFVGGVVTATLCSHVAGDAITPMGIRPFRPFWGAHFTLDVTPAKDPRANRLFLGVGLVAVALSVGATP